MREQQQATYTFPMVELSLGVGNEHVYSNDRIPECAEIKAVRPLEVIRLELSWSDGGYSVRFSQPALLEIHAKRDEHHEYLQVQTFSGFHDIYESYTSDGRLPLLHDGSELLLSLMARGLVSIGSQEELGRKLVHSFAVADVELRKKLKKRYPKWWHNWEQEWTSSNAVSACLKRTVLLLAHTWPYNIQTGDAVGRANLEKEYDNDFDATLDLIRKSLKRLEYEKKNVPKEMPEWWHKMIDGATAPLIEELDRLETIRAGHEVRKKLKKVTRKRSEVPF